MHEGRGKKGFWFMAYGFWFLVKRRGLQRTRPAYNQKPKTSNQKPFVPRAGLLTSGSP